MQNEQAPPKKVLASSAHESQQEYSDPHMKSSLLPKIHKTTALAKHKNNQHGQAQGANLYNTKILLGEIDQYEKRMKMAGIINDYLENFKNKQKGSILAFSSQKSKLEQKPIKVEGISHSKFMGNEHVSENGNTYSLDSKKMHRIKINRSFIEKIRKDCKTDDIKAQSKVHSKKFYTESDSNLQSLSDLKGYILKAKKSVIDCRQPSRQKISRTKKLSQIGPW